MAREVEASFPNVVLGVALAILKEQLDKLIRSTAPGRLIPRGHSKCHHINCCHSSLGKQECELCRCALSMKGCPYIYIYMSFFC